MSLRRTTQLSRVALALAVTLWLAKWTAVQVEPGHGSFFLLVVAGFLVSTLPNWTKLRG